MSRVGAEPPPSVAPRCVSAAVHASSTGNPAAVTKADIVYNRSFLYINEYCKNVFFILQLCTKYKAVQPNDVIDAGQPYKEDKMKQAIMVPSCGQKMQVQLITW